jgi:hypothetical protein
VPKGLYGRLLERKPTPEDAAAVTALVNEYVNGNERAYASVLNDQFLSLVSELANSSIIYTLAQTLYIAPGATYTFSGSLVIDTIRISKTGNLHPTNVFKVDATNWIEF